MNAEPSTADVKEVLVQTLGVEGRADAIDDTTPLLDTVPELDSMGVVALMFALEERFDITTQDDDMRAEVFETLTSLTAMVRQRTGSLTD